MSAPGLLKEHLHLKKLGQLTVQQKDKETPSWIEEGKWIWMNLQADLQKGVQDYKQCYSSNADYLP